MAGGGNQPDGIGAARLADPQEERDHEHRVPDRREWTHRAGSLAQVRVQTQNGRNSDQRLPRRPFGQQRQHQNQRDDPAQIAKGPARPRDAANLLRGAKVGQHRIGEGGGKFHADQPDSKADHDEPQVHITGGGPPYPPGPQHIHQREEGDKAHPVPAAVCHRPQKRRQNGNQNARSTNAIAPDGLRRRPAAQQAGHVGTEDEGQQQGVVGLAGPVEEEPAPDTACRCRHPGSPCARCDRTGIGRQAQVA